MTETNPKKVRSACQRCRLRRVKCDGSIPACGNCARAGTQCVDVDSHNTDQLIPRSFLVNGPARIRWLEDVIRTHLPSFDLAQGPQVDALPFSEGSLRSSPEDAHLPKSLSPTAGTTPLRASAAPFAASSASATAAATATAPVATSGLPSGSAAAPAATEHTPKRPASQFSADADDRPLRDEVRSVAIDLRLLSLNADSRQKHYLGSSSGMVFTRIIGADEPTDTATSYPSTSTSRLATPAPTYAASCNGAAASARMRPNGTYDQRGANGDSSGGPTVQPHHTMPPPRPGIRPASSRSRGARLQQRAERQNLQVLHRHLQRDLPSKEETYSLLEVFFSELHMHHPIMHAPSVLKAVEALYDCADLGPSAALGRNGWPESVKPFSYNGEWGLDADHTEHTEATEGATETTPISIYTAAAHVFMVLNLAATSRTRDNDFNMSPTRLYRAAMACASECFSTISLPSLQCLLLLTVRALVMPAEVNIWTLVHVSMAHCIDLGIHREAIVVGRGGGPVAAHVRRTVFYTAYTLERSVAAIQGRPLGVRDESFDVALPEANAPVTSGSAAGPSSAWAEDDDDAAAVIISLAAQSLPYSVHDFKFYRIISRIKNALYLLPHVSDTAPVSTQPPPATAEGERLSSDASSAPPPEDLSSSWWAQRPLQCQQTLRKQLEDWRAAIPSVVEAMTPATPEKAARLHLKLELRYHQGMVLLHQPSQAIRQPSPEALGACFVHAAERVRGYDTLYSQDSLYLSWRTVQGILSSGTIMIACFWAAMAYPGAVVLPSTSSSPNTMHSTSLLSSSAPENAAAYGSGSVLHYNDLAKDLRTCSGLLSASGAWWPSAKRGKDAFERMVDQTLRRHAQLMQSGFGTGEGTDGRVAKMPRLSNHGQPGPALSLSPMPSSSSVVGGLMMDEDNSRDNDTYMALNALADLREKQQPQQHHTQQHQQPHQNHDSMYNMDMLQIAPSMESLMGSLEQGDPNWDLFGSVPVLNWFDASIGQ
ncbi:Transcription factor [Niveomyces insectorum RCEF 264]|uniref:Transcription factor n=1 Tax=Niveomyces insectorum RCEF 264 TaxID=1081102 RepID=A0A167T7N5_9HYPO|nr:Transcription factor [Niveomyces insectorum RCEF 264]